MKKLLISLSALLSLSCLVNNAVGEELYAIQIHNQSDYKIVFDGYMSRRFVAPNWIDQNGSITVLPHSEAKVLRGIHDTATTQYRTHSISYRIRLHDQSLDTSDKLAFKNILVTLYSFKGVASIQLKNDSTTIWEEHGGFGFKSDVAGYSVGCQYIQSLTSSSWDCNGGGSYIAVGNDELNAADAHMLDIWVRNDGTFITQMTGTTQRGFNISDKMSPWPIEYEAKLAQTSLSAKQAVKHPTTTTKPTPAIAKSALLPW